MQIVLIQYANTAPLDVPGFLEWICKNNYNIGRTHFNWAPKIGLQLAGTHRKSTWKRTAARIGTLWRGVGKNSFAPAMAIADPKEDRDGNYQLVLSECRAGSDAELVHNRRYRASDRSG